MLFNWTRMQCCKVTRQNDIIDNWVVCLAFHWRLCFITISSRLLDKLFSYTNLLFAGGQFNTKRNAERDTIKQLQKQLPRPEESSHCHGTFHSELDAVLIAHYDRKLQSNLLRKQYHFPNPSNNYIWAFSCEQCSKSNNLWCEIPRVQCGSTVNVWLHQWRWTSRSAGICHVWIRFM